MEGATRYANEMDQVEAAGADSGSGFPSVIPPVTYPEFKRTRPLDLFSSSSPLREGGGGQKQRW